MASIKKPANSVSDDSDQTKTSSKSGISGETGSKKAHLVSQFFQFYQENPCPAALLFQNSLIATNKAFISLFPQIKQTNQIPLADVFKDNVLDEIRLLGNSGGDVRVSKEEIKIVTGSYLEKILLKLIPLAGNNFALLLFTAEYAAESQPLKSPLPGSTALSTVVDAILNNAPFGVFSYDKEGWLNYANPTFWQIFGYSDAEQTKINWFTLDTAIKQGVTEKLSRVFETGEQSFFDIEYVSSKEKHSFIKLFLLPIKGSDGKPETVVALVEDNTREKKIAADLERTRDLMKNLLDNVPDNIYFKDTQSRFILTSKAHAKVLGIHLPDDAIGKTDFDFYEEKHAHNAYNDEQRIIATGKALVDKTEKIISDNGSVRFVSSTKAPMYDSNGKIIGLVGISRNITDRVLVDEELVRVNESLTQSKIQLEEKTKKIEKVNAELEASQKELQEINASKDKFFSIIAHDLKSPFHGLLGLSSIMVEDADVLTCEESKHYLVTMNQTLRDTYNLIENLLSWSRLQTSRWQMLKENLNLWKEAHNLITMFEPVAIKKRITIINEVENGLFVTADSNMFHSMIQNLISNAVKFTPAEGTIRVSAKRENDVMQIKVSDTGLGMSPAEQELIFRIDKNHSTLGTAGEKGTGLGVLLVKEMMEKHDGKISVNSIKGKGTEFTLAFPVIG